MQDDAEIEPEGLGADVLQVDAEFVGHDLLDVGLFGMGGLRQEMVFVAVFDGSFIGDTGAHAENLSLFGGIEIDVFLYFGAGTYEAHLPQQYIDQLR